MKIFLYLNLQRLSAIMQVKRKSFLDSFRRSLTFGEADKKRSAFSKQRENQMEQPLLSVSVSSDDTKRHSSCEKSSFEDSSFDVEVKAIFSPKLFFLKAIFSPKLFFLKAVFSPSCFFSKQFFPLSCFFSKLFFPQAVFSQSNFFP